MKYTAEMFLEPNNFITRFDRPERGIEQEKKGKAIGDEYDVVSISTTDVWSACKPGTSLQSCEKLGFHANTADLLRGFLASKARIIVYRWDGVNLSVRELRPHAQKPSASGHCDTPD